MNPSMRTYLSIVEQVHGHTIRDTSSRNSLHGV